MSKKKGRPGAATPGQPTNKDMVTPPDFRSQKDCSIFPTREQGQVEKLLRPGHENAISTRVLVDLVGCGSARQLQTIIAAERARGALILSSAAGGYYLPSDGPEGREELRRFIDTLRARAVSTLRTMQHARIALDVLEGQLEVDGWQTEER